MVDINRFHIGITTGEGREAPLTYLLFSLAAAKCSIPVDIIYNNHSGSKIDDLQKRIPGIWGEIPLDMYLYFTDKEVSLSTMRNRVALLRKDRDYVIWTCDDCLFLVDDLQKIVNKHEEFDLIRCAYDSVVSISKKLLAKVGWLDERYLIRWGDVDFYHRLSSLTGKGDQFFQFGINEVATHIHWYIDKFDKTKEQGPEFHKIKWGNDANPHIPAGRAPLIDDIPLYVIETSYFLNTMNLREENQTLHQGGNCAYEKENSKENSTEKESADSSPS